MSALPWLHKLQIADMKSVKSTQHELKASTTWTGVEGALALARAAQRVRVVEGPVLLLRRGRGQRGRSVDWLGRKQLGSFSSLCTPLLSELPSKSGQTPKP